MFSKVYKLKSSRNVRDCIDSSGIELSDVFEQIRALPKPCTRDKDHIVPLVAEAIANGKSVLVFCCSRRQCETCANMICESLFGLCSLYVREEMTCDISKRQRLVQKLQVHPWCLFSSLQPLY